MSRVPAPGLEGVLHKIENCCICWSAFPTCYTRRVNGRPLPTSKLDAVGVGIPDASIFQQNPESDRWTEVPLTELDRDHSQ